ncbi:hypothetical protein EI74_0568 [Mycoplasma testudineum]|uniref:Uncharacterized protein n=1 Tax=Mycoplasma testudineum TaxID=244584 RepID=A0A4R6IE93_9MOLU|nr:hypothetical protein [Mycoplasma testudineum]OYD26792.1 hypothetical protein CG473_02450 [Mycoplasma testudineum]TDO19928.1 hypothetical protein EI74_0568 [Mycoplasma testudineum]
MYLKYKQEEIELITTKIIVASNILKVLTNLKPVELVIKPGTKIEDIFSLSSSNYLIKYLNKEFEEELVSTVDENKLVNILDKMESKNVDYLQYNLPISKYWKLFFEIVNKEVTLDNIEHILNVIDDSLTSEICIAFLGVDNYFSKLKLNYYKNIRIVFISNSVANFSLGIDEISYLTYISKSENVIDVIDASKFISYIELQTKSALNTKSLNDYLKGIANFDTFLISRHLEN